MIAPPKPPSHDDLEALIKEARARQLRRRLLGAGGVAIPAAIGLVVYALSIGGNGDGRASQLSPSAAAPPCRSSQLAASSYWNGAAGTLINFFAIVNRGGSACSLPRGRPAVQLRRHQSPLRIHEEAPRPGSFPGKPLRTLAPGKKAAVYMQWSNWCGRPHSGLTTTIRLRFGNGLSVAARHVLGQPPCVDRALPSTITVSELRTPN